ncbi:MULTISPECIES: tyrosine-protein phosphatase [unclassified Tenacibaculum]|uniref:tyrosine-protein phosphatase n=1 Tax=unclassified Tenacibaculum TaxID=2635139 RepID=UPI001F3218AC|nr:MULTISPECIES: CpsB/CapC family capsule biosynthesis tyrosine phosphatase [unclassified Tenacibaculum]MCF2876589.1 histidinol phosphatase [Tenacibaculum sp. Cn5-1]MCF2936740.1 histidinol phosphatase [Tenacibaculum sp. Cn5-34]MCG7512964.1 histidinol phosphatase [Tenacibaculum sp. Cn5-46]
MLFFKKKEIPLNELFPEGFIDIHSHLLPGIDDGAKDLENSISLITKMYSYGIKNFITTPHVLGDVYPNSSRVIQEKLEVVKLELKKQGFDDIKINAAAEYMMDEQFVERLKEGDILTLKDNYILVEMSYFNAPYNLYDVLFEIQLKGYKPVLAHPERYNFYHKDFQNFYKLKKAGCVFQLNLLSLTEQYGKGVQKTAQKLLNENMYDFVGTDTHHHNHLKLLNKIGTVKTRKQIEHLLNNNKKFL